ncbi:MAG: basic amino acid ABC transporter substrate-binding protein [Otoolea sp.]
MKKQFAALSMAAMMAAVSLAGCSSKPAETAAPATEAATEAASEAAETEAEETEAAAESKGTLVMATNAEFPPYEFHDGGEIVGIDVEIAAAIAKELGMDFEVEDIAFDSIIPEVQSGKADFGAAGITVTEDRKQSVDFSDTYATATQVIIVKEDNTEIGTPDDLVGKTIGVQLGTTGDIYASDIEDATIEQYNKGFEAVQALSQNKIDAVIIDGEPAKVFVSENEGLKILDEAFTTEEYAICVKKGNTELLEDINTAIANLKESGELQEIVDKYITAE